MRNFMNTARIAALAALACLAASSTSMAADSDGPVGRDAKRGGARYSAPVAFNPDHQSTIRIRESDGLPAHKGIKLGRNKSTLVEVPRELRDVIVSNPEIMDAVVQSSNRVYLIGKKVGQSNAFFFDINGKQIVTLEVSIEHDTSVLESLFKRLIPGSNIKAEVLNETVILSGTVRAPADAARASSIASRFIVTPTPEAHERHPAKVINMIAVEGEEQVMLQVVVAEMQRSIMKQFGINLGAEINIGNFATGFMTANGLPLTSAAGLTRMGQVGSDVAKPIGQGCVAVLDESLTEGVVGNSGFNNHWKTGNNCSTQVLRALERDGLVRTLAEPNLTAISGETARFLAGGEYPIPVVDSVGKLSVTFKEFGIGVTFTPVVMSEGRINLKIETEVSELTDVGAVVLSGIAIPALKKRKANSTVEMPSGGTLAMAGLLSDDTRKNIDGFPGLKDVPMLGTLFRSQDYIKRETELVVLVTPYMVRPTARKQFARPDDGFAPASDLKSNLLGHMNRVYGKGGPLPVDGGLKGDVGFIVE
ncbi:MAG: type II and III secretion system protein family protein [Rhodospirillales bacterium]|nr:type II and III secretion system protein family protein [Rhodospirillales bacterium]